MKAELNAEVQTLKRAVEVASISSATTSRAHSPGAQDRSHNEMLDEMVHNLQSQLRKEHEKSGQLQQEIDMLRSELAKSNELYGFKRHIL